MKNDRGSATRTSRRGLCAYALLCGLLAVGIATPARAEEISAASTELDLSRAVVVTPQDLSGPQRKAVDMLLDEVERHSRLRWSEAHAWPSDGRPVVAVGPASRLPAFAGPYADSWSAKSASLPAEGFTLRVMDGKAVLVVGNDPRGVLFGVGRLLREIHLARDVAHVSSSLDLTTSPKYPLRGHQLGYRPKVNSYDGWTAALWEQYIRDLAVFGTNSIELLPPAHG